MGLIKAIKTGAGYVADLARQGAAGIGGNLANNAVGSLSGVVKDQYREFFICDTFEPEVLAVEGRKRDTKGNNKGNDNIISNGSLIVVNAGQAALIVDQGKVVELCAEEGEYVYDASSEPSIFYGNLGENLLNSFKELGKRISFGGEIPKDQRVYYINIAEVRDNLWGTASPIPFSIHDEASGFRGTISLMGSGMYTYEICDPIRFYTYVCKNFRGEFRKKEIHNTMRQEFLTALQPALGSFSSVGLDYGLITTMVKDLKNSLNDELSEDWGKLRGIRVVSVAFQNLNATPEDEKRIKQFQDTAVYTNVNMAAARMVTAQANAMEAAASNTSTGPMMAFAGMNMAQMAGGMNANNLFAMGQQQAPQQPVQQQAAPQMAPQSAVGGWTCKCGTTNTGKFCLECGAQKPAADAGWTCTCGAVNKGKFCPECGAQKPAGTPVYRCDKCGWEPTDPSKAPKFCPECGDIFDDNDIVK